MSWAEVKKINSDFNKPLNELIYGIDEYLYYPKGKLILTIGRNVEVILTNDTINKTINTKTDKFGYLQLELIYGNWEVDVVGDQVYDVVIRDIPLVIENGDKLTLADVTWEEINEASKYGIASSMFEIGDEKAISFDSGTSRTFTLVGKNHDDLVSGGKASLSFVSKANIGNSNMNGTNTNNTGWTTSNMRVTTIANMYNSLPQDTKNIIKEVSKKTSVGNNVATIGVTYDKLWLLSEIEAFGVLTHSFAGEGNHYPFFVDNASRNHGAHYWLRSPMSGNTTLFVNVSSNGAVYYDNASTSNGVVPGFCI